MHRYEILHLTTEHARYADVILRAAADPVLTAAMWADGAIEWELDGTRPDRDLTTWTVVLEAGTDDIMAMAAWRLTDEDGVPTALCRAHHHARGFRDYPWFGVAFVAREFQIRHLAAEAWVYDEPEPLFAAAGYVTVDRGRTTEPDLPERTWHRTYRSARA